MSNYNYKERTESLKILSKKKESLESRIKIEENQILEIKNKINLLKDQILEIENRWKDLQNKYKGAYEISRQQGLTKMNKNRSLNSEEIYAILNDYGYNSTVRFEILSAAGSKSKVNSLNAKISELKLEISKIQLILDYKKSELVKIQKEINNFDTPTLF